MTEVEIIEEIAAAQSLSKATVAAVFHQAKDVMRKALESGESVTLIGFGALRVEKHKKKQLFGKPRGEGFWVKVKFHPSRRKPLGKVRRSSG